MNFTGIPQVDVTMGKVIALFSGIITAIGVFRIITGIKDLSNAVSEGDQARKEQGMTAILSGVIMVVPGAVLTYLGIAVL